MSHFLPGKNRKEKLEQAEELLESGSRAFEQNNFPEGLKHYQEAYLIKTDVLGTDHPDGNEIASQLGQKIGQANRQAEAKSFFEQSLLRSSSRCSRSSRRRKIQKAKAAAVFTARSTWPWLNWSGRSPTRSTARMTWSGRASGTSFPWPRRKKPWGMKTAACCFCSSSSSG